MDAAELESKYRRWLAEVWGQGRTDVAQELMADDLVDHNLCCPSGTWLSAPRSLTMRTSVPESVAVRTSGSRARNAVAESGW